MRSALVLAALAAAASCKGREAEPAGIGKWRFNVLTLGAVKDGKCEPTAGTDGRQLTWCFAQPAFKIAKRVAEVNAYFLGTNPDAPLVEVQLSVRGCVEDELDQWLRANYGPPIETKANRVYWKNSFIWIAAIMPSDPGRCLVHILPLSENAEIGRIKAEGDAVGSGSGSAH